MIKFIPVKGEELKGEYIVLSKLLSFSWARCYGVIGARDGGKTYGIKKICTEDNIFEGKKFIVIRDTQTACDEVVKNGGLKFFKDIFTFEKKFANHNYDIVNYQIKIDGKHAGEVMPLDAYYKYKGNYYDCENIFFDEFIPERQQQYRGNRARAFVNTLETLMRSRTNCRVFMTANALELGNDILELLDIHIKNGQYGYYINTDKKVVIFYAPDSPGFIERRKKSAAANMSKGSFLDANFNNNEFEEEDCVVFEKRPPCNLYGIYYSAEGECVRLYKANEGNQYFVCKDINPKSYGYMRYCFHISQVGANRTYAPDAVRKFLARLLELKQVKFESRFVFGIYCAICQKTLKKH